jgi:hypothetical protein
MTQGKIMDSLDAMRAILMPFDDAGRESMVATIVLWLLSQHEDRDAAMLHLLGRVAEIELDVDVPGAPEVLQ